MQAVVERLINRYPDLAVCATSLSQAADLLTNAFRTDHTVLLCGNGGSAADCEHIVGELAKAFQRPRPLPSVIQQVLLEQDGAAGASMATQLQRGLPALSLTSQGALISAIANDLGADLIFAQQVIAYGRTGDVVWGISTSGHSANVCQALRVARAMGLNTLGLTGATGGLFPALCDIAICVPRTTVADIQELHLPVYHALCTLVEEHLFP